jgi:hypothetical protein
VVSHGGGAVVDFGGVGSVLSDVDVLAEEMEPGAEAGFGGASAEAVAYGLETLPCEVAWDSEDAEELEGLGEGISSRKIERRESLIFLSDKT